MIDLDRFWMDQGDDRIDIHDDEDKEGPGATPDELAEWEQTHGVRLPELLRAALVIRNGGRLRDVPLDVHPLDRIKPVDDDFRGHAYTEEEVEDWDLVFEFAEHAEVDLGFLLDFNANGPQGEPSVATYTHGDIEVEPAADSFAEFMAAQVETDEAPAVDWNETNDAPDVLAREVVEIENWGGESLRLEQVLVRRGTGLIFYTRQSAATAEELARTILPGPIVAGLASINAYRPPPDATLALHLQSEELDGIVHVASSRSGDGGWKNSETHGAPCYVAFESADRARLEALRSTVLGEAAHVAETRQANQDAMNAKLAAMTPEDRTAALFQAATELASEMPPLDPGLTPDSGFHGLTSLSEILRRKIAEASQGAGADAEIDPETLRLIKEGLRPPGLDPAPPDEG
jgi:hypothetical protein